MFETHIKSSVYQSLSFILHFEFHGFRCYIYPPIITLASSTEETNPWTENATAGAWQSGNYQVASSTSTIESKWRSGRQ